MKTQRSGTFLSLVYELYSKLRILSLTFANEFSSNRSERGVPNTNIK